MSQWTTPTHTKHCARQSRTSSRHAVAKSIITNVIMLIIAAAFAWFFVNAFDAWYQDKENRRAIKREQRARNQHNRYE